MNLVKRQDVWKKVNGKYHVHEWDLVYGKNGIYSDILESEFTILWYHKVAVKLLSTLEVKHGNSPLKSPEMWWRISFEF